MSLAVILARSRGQKIRGLKHRQFRPRAVIIDDPEDLKWFKTKENRDGTENWLNSEVIPALDRQKRKLVILINNLHMDALAARVKAKGTFKVLEYPLVNDAGTWESCIWKTGPCCFPAPGASNYSGSYSILALRPMTILWTALCG
jgi:hypothetical protein